MDGALIFNDYSVYITNNILSHYKLLLELKEQSDIYFNAIKNNQYIRIISFENQIGIEIFEDYSMISNDLKMLIYNTIKKLNKNIDLKITLENIINEKITYCNLSDLLKI